MLLEGSFRCKKRYLRIFFGWEKETQKKNGEKTQDILREGPWSKERKIAAELGQTRAELVHSMKGFWDLITRIGSGGEWGQGFLSPWNQVWGGGNRESRCFPEKIGMFGKKETNDKGISVEGAFQTNRVI